MQKAHNPEAIILPFLNEKFRNETNVVLFGSNAHVYNAGSDIDILIVSRHADSFSKEVFQYQGHVLEVILIPFHEFNNYMERDKFLKVYIDILVKGRIVLDEDQFLQRTIRQIKQSSVPENAYLLRIQLEKQIAFYIFKMSKSTNVYEAEIYFNRMAENCYTRRLLDFGITNIDSAKHLVDKILALDFDLVETLYKLKKKLMHHRHMSVVLPDLDKVLNVRQIWVNTFYANRFVLSEIYGDRMVVFVERNKRFEQRLEKLLGAQSVVHYSFAIDSGNTGKEGKYYVILEDRSRIVEAIIPQLQRHFLEGDDLLHNDSKIIFPFLIDVQILLGIPDPDEFAQVEALFLQLCQCFARNSSNAVWAAFQILKQCSPEQLERFVYILAGKTNVFKNNLYLSQSQQYLIDLKNRLYDTQTVLTPGDTQVFFDNICNENAIGIEKVSAHFDKIHTFISQDQTDAVFNIAHFIFNIFEIRDYQKPYLAALIKKMTDYAV